MPLTLPPRAARLALLACALLLAAPGPARADELEAEAEAERREAAERHAERAFEAFTTGNHEEVLKRMERVARYAPESPIPFLLKARVFERTGRTREALAEAQAGALAHPDDRRLGGLVLELLLATGQRARAEREAEALLAGRPDDLRARAAYAAALEARGARAEALAQYDRILEAWNSGSPPEEEHRYVARAAARITWLSPDPGDDLLQSAVRLLEQRVKAHPDDHDARLELAELWRSDRGPDGQALARRNFELILKRNSEVPEARVGLARVMLVFWRQHEARRELERALATHPHLPEAHALLAAIHTGNGDYEQAERNLAAALAANPEHLEALSVRGALHYIRGEDAAFEATRDQVLAANPRYGAFFVVCAELVGERQRRYDRAVDLARRAIQVDPDDRRAYTALGEALMNRGRTDEALEVFRTGVEKSKRYKDVHRDNWIEVIGQWMPTFKVLESPRFRIRMPLADAAVLRHYLPDLLAEAEDELATRYGVAVEHPTHVDVFDRVDDFSVRSIGVPGLPALGVCFGNVVTLLSPTARPLGQFSWSRTAWHEFAHVVTLQCSEGQVPRWLTEGLSVYEEQRRRPRWGRDMELELYNRWRNGRLLKMSEINGAFRGPDIMFAYYQGGLIAAHLQQERGFEVIPKMLRAFAADRTTARVFQEVLGLELAQYDELFERYVAGRVGGYRLVPTWDDRSLKALEERVAKEPTDGEAWARLGWAHLQRNRAIDAGAALLKAEAHAPGHPEVRLLKARVAERSGRQDLAEQHYREALAAGVEDFHLRLFLADRALAGPGPSAAALEHLEAAKRCFPAYIGRDSPYLQLARLYRGEGEMAKAIAELEAYAAIAAEDYDVRRELKGWYLAQEDWEAVARVSEEMNDVSPFGANVLGGREPPDLTLHRDWERALTQLGREAEALRELEVQVEILRLLPEAAQAEAGLLDTLLSLGERLLAAGRAEEALAQALAALRLDPQRADARMLKQRAEEAGAGR